VNYIANVELFVVGVEEWMASEKLFRARGCGVKNASRMTTVRIPAADSKANKQMHKLSHVAILLPYESFYELFY
jgi:hypothetical protein